MTTTRTDETKLQAAYQRGEQWAVNEQVRRRKLQSAYERGEQWAVEEVTAARRNAVLKDA